MGRDVGQQSTFIGVERARRGRRTLLHSLEIEKCSQAAQCRLELRGPTALAQLGWDGMRPGPLVVEDLAGMGGDPRG